MRKGLVSYERKIMNDERLLDALLIVCYVLLAIVFAGFVVSIVMVFL